MIEVIVYGKESCPQCVTAKNLMDRFNDTTPSDYKCTYKKLDVDFTREELFAIFPDAKTFPQISVNGTSVTFDQFKTTIESLL